MLADVHGSRGWSQFKQTGLEQLFLSKIIPWGGRISVGTELAVRRVLRENVLHNLPWFREGCLLYQVVEFLKKYCATGPA